MPLFLVRHGETRLSGTFCGSSNPPLNAHGRSQAAAAARRLASFSFLRCEVSPLLRAQQTAKIIQRQVKIPLVTRTALREIDFGVWEGLSFSDVQTKWPGQADGWMKNPTKVRIPRAETFAGLGRRVKRFLSFTKKSIERGNVLIVAHGGTNAAMILQLLGLPITEFRKQIQPLGSVRIIEGSKMRTLC